jgi:hypothetical protein
MVVARSDAFEAGNRGKIEAICSLDRFAGKLAGEQYGPISTGLQIDIQSAGDFAGGITGKYSAPNTTFHDRGHL